MSFTYRNKNGIRYNGYDLDFYQLCVIDDDIELENQLGVRQTVNSNNNYFVNVDKENFTFTLKFIRKVNGVPSSLDVRWTNGTFLDEINRLFFSNKEVNLLEIGGRIYYVIPISGSLKRHSKNVGEFSIEFQSLSPYCYTPIYTSTLKVNSTNSPKEITLGNKGNDVYATIKAEIIADGDLIVTNKKNGETLTVKDCRSGEIFIIDGDNIDVQWIDYSRVTGNIKDTLTLKFGDTTFSIKCNDARVGIEYQCEMNIW
ncbi:hypothetical protein A500_04521 [Clostridium sartagoforme AAU1]|uniref:Phage tail-like C-terminal domain-containing protein n=1 Tax=Clostridium sartagoforme AAU1 TaxID=1202534 RepID=R9CEL5_9CLOT|nr:phage tail domain-containing protein [Clostridium sartagoforme]EOR27455.1 hypothetical protein A500_04521 [Clostridium sartagoforme AAU1]